MTTDLPTPISTDGPPVDVPLLRKAVEWAEAEAAKPLVESEWYQGSYVEAGSSLGRSCGTAYCIAGFVAAVLDGPAVAERLGGLCYERARDAMGLTGSESGRLFSGDNSITYVRTIAERIAARAGERL